MSTLPKVRTLSGASPTHPLVAIADLVGCGDSWCDGRCGVPALVLLASDDRPEMKVHSDMVAFGRVMQPFRVKWSGQKTVLPESLRSYLMQSYWF